MTDTPDILFALDPSTTRTGWALFHDTVLVKAGSVAADRDQDRWSRQSHILTSLMDIMIEVGVDWNRTSGYTVVSEEPMVQGRNGLALHKLLGAFEGIFNIPIDYIHPSTVKKVMGSGKLDKFEVALAAGRLVKTDKEQEIIASLISEEDFDATDAIAIGLCWMEMRK